MSWRPDKWNNPYPSDHFTQAGKVYYETDAGRHNIYEAGADAMLEALKIRGFHTHKDHLEFIRKRGETTARSGWTVFIPDDEK